MNKILIASLSLAFLGNASVGICGWDFASSHTEGVPPTFCWLRQDLGHQTYNGYLNLPCEGDACPAINTTFNVL